MDLQQILSVILSVLGSLILVCLAVLLGILPQCIFLFAYYYFFFIRPLFCLFHKIAETFFFIVVM